MKSYNSIQERIEILEDKLTAIHDEIETLKTPAKNNNERIIFKFIEHHNII